MRWLLCRLALALATAAPALAGAEAAVAALAPTAPFHDGRYRLGYEVYLNNGNVEAAYALADKAVRLQPHDLAWRRRLAQVARWSGRARVALDNWLRVARGTDTAETWAQVRELAPQLFDREAWLAVQQLLLIAHHYPSARHLAFDFLRPRYLYPSLMAVGLFYNLGIWMDKLLFWFFPATSQAVIGPWRASVIYDMPVFLAYLSIIPGMAVFLVKIETDFVEYYERFYDAVRHGSSLAHIEQIRNEMVDVIRQALYQIMKVQTIAVLFMVMASEALLELIGISTLYQPLLLVNVIAAGLQVVFLGVLNVFFYLDKRRIVLGLTAALVVLNAAFTLASFRLGPEFYGYGFALALLVVVLAGFWLLDRKLEVLEYETFMLQ